MSREQFVWVEKYRPSTLDQCILPVALKASFQSFVAQKEIPNLIMAGGAGTGKTTVAKAMCEMLGADYLFQNASSERGIDQAARDLRIFAGTGSLQDTGVRKYIILDEADNLTPDAQAALRHIMEEYLHNCGFLLTVNYPAKLIPALHSRCALVKFEIPVGEQAAIKNELYKRLNEILKQEGITPDKPVLISVIKRYFPDFRRILNELQRHAANGTISEAILGQVSDVAVPELFGLLKKHDFANMRKWIGEHSDLSGEPSFYSLLYEKSDGFVKPESVPEILIILADYQMKHTLSVDGQLCATACCTELMKLEGAFK
jgi:replication-associated recombination protein RarA